MRSIALLSVLVLVGAVADDADPTFIEASEGSTIHMYVPPKNGHNIQMCQIQNPKGEIFEFFPLDRLVDLSLIPSAMSRLKDCAIDIRLSKVAHSGRWALIATRKSNDGTVDETKKTFLIFVKGKSVGDVLSTRRFVLKANEVVTIKIPRQNEDSVLNGCSLKDHEGRLVEDINHDTLDECQFDFQAKENHEYGRWTLQSSYVPIGKEVYEQSQQPFFAVLEGQEIQGQAELLPRITRATTVGGSLSFSIQDSKTITPTCYLTQPNSQELNLENVVKDNSLLGIRIDPDISTCNVVFDPLSHEMAGDWILVAVYNQGIEEEFHYIQPFTVVVAVVEAPTTVNTNRLDQRGFIVDIGGEFTASLPYQNDYAEGSCFLTNQDNEIIQLKPQNGLTVESIQLHDSDTECTVTFKNVTMAQGGDWSLSSIFRSAPQEMQHYIQPFTVFFRGRVNTVPSFAVTVQEGENLYLRLRDPVEGLTNCRVDPPSAEVSFETDARFAQHCGIVVKNVPASADGMWHMFATGYRPENGVFLVEVTEKEEEDEQIKHLLPHRVTTLFFGPSNAVYCDARDSNGVIHFRGFGPCLVHLERPNVEHSGLWSVSIGLPGRMALMQRDYHVRVVTTDYDVISAYVSPETTTVPTSLNCRMWTTAEVRTCAFRRPDGQIFLMHDGVGSDRYSFFGVGTEEASIGVMTSCGISINKLNREDIGTWQCMIETSTNTNTGFMTVHDETDHTDNSISVTRSGPGKTTVGSRVRLSCSIERPIRYCLFRHPNRTIMSLPNLPVESMFKFGDDGTRLDAGKCAMQIHSVDLSDEGSWQCILGTTGTIGGNADLIWPIRMDVYSSALVLRTEGRQGTRGLLMEASTYDQSAVEYCRYVRPDGLSFNEKSAMSVADYLLWNTNINMGICSLVIQSTSQVDLGEWTIAVKRVGHFQEDIVRVDLRLVSGVSGMSIWIMVLLVIALTLLFISCFGLCMNRRHPGWVRKKALVVRNSFRRKQPPQTITTNGP